MKRMITLHIPEDPDIQAAVGRIALRHGQLDYGLRLAVKSILGISVADALDATDRQGTRDLRMRVRKLAKQKIGEGEALCKLDALLNRSRRLTDRRNSYLHNLWAQDENGNPIIGDDECKMGPIPTIAELDVLADELAHVTWDLNRARLNGFLAEALRVKVSGNAP